MTLHPPTTSAPPAAHADSASAAARCRAANRFGRDGLVTLAMVAALCGYLVLTLWPLAAAAADPVRGPPQAATGARELPAFEAVDMAGT